MENTEQQGRDLTISGRSREEMPDRQVLYPELSESACSFF